MAAIGCLDNYPGWAEELTSAFPNNVRVIDAPIRCGLEDVVYVRAGRSSVGYYAVITGRTGSTTTAASIRT